MGDPKMTPERAKLLVLQAPGPYTPVPPEETSGWGPCIEGQYGQIVARMVAKRTTAARERRKGVTDLFCAAPDLARAYIEASAKVQRLEQLLAEVTGERDRARAAADRLHAERKGEVWIWAGDGTDDPETLACPVLMTAEQARRLFRHGESA